MNIKNIKTNICCQKQPPNIFMLLIISWWPFFVQCVMCLIEINQQTEPNNIIMNSANFISKLMVFRGDCAIVRMSKILSFNPNGYIILISFVLVIFDKLFYSPSCYEIRYSLKSVHFTITFNSLHINLLTFFLQ
jgi:hypothetical protein